MAIVVKPMSGHTGAEIEGLDLAGELDDDIIGEIRAALLRWKVVFFRDQKLGHAEHVAFGRRFGKLTPGNPWGKNLADGYPEIFALPLFQLTGTGEEPSWHTDIQNTVNPPLGSILRGDVVPPYGGDTCFTNLVAAYEGLPAPLRELADGLRSVNEKPPAEGNRVLDTLQESERTVPLIAEHPVVRVHPETGERALWVGAGWTRSIVGLSSDQSRRILDLFFAQISKPEFTVRFRWTPGSVAFWDNRAAAHLPPSDLHVLGECRREMYRVTVVGDVPVGPDGQPSRLISGTPFEAVS